LLQALGLSSAAGLTPSLAPRRAAAADPPRFLGIMFSEHGVVPKRFYFTKGVLPKDQPWQFTLDDMQESDFSEDLRPLWRHRKKMIIVEGLAHLTAPKSAGDDHGRGMTTAISGAIAPTADGGKSISGGPSLDQIVAADLRSKDPSLTSLTGLVMGTANQNYPYHHVVWAQTAAGLVKVPVRGDYAQLAATLFGNVKPAGSPAAVDPITANQNRILDLAASEYLRLSKVVAREDGLRLDQHRQLLADLQKRLSAVPQVPVSCARPTTITPGDYKANAQIMSMLSAAAWNCRLSRVSYHSYFQVPISLVNGSGDFHQDYAHRWNSNAEAERGCSAADKLHAGWFAAWADELDRIPNGSGGTLLDSSALLWTGEIANGGHGHSPAHIVILGGGGGRFKTGRYVYFPWGKRGHNHVLVSLAQMMGVQTNTVGVSSVDAVSTSGPLAELAG
jgi:hypothetical protein